MIGVPLAGFYLLRPKQTLEAAVLAEFTHGGLEWARTKERHRHQP